MLTHRHILLLFLGLFFGPAGARSQCPYYLNWKREMTYLAPGGTLLGTGWLLYQNIEGLSDAEIEALDRNRLGLLDRGATFNQSAAAADWSDRLSTASYFLPALFAVREDTRSDLGKIALLYGETLLLNKALTLTAKSVFLRPRPFVYNETFDADSKTKPSARLSFFSGHTSSSAANSFFTAKVFSDYFPESRLRPFVWTTAALIPALTGYFRVAAGKHYPSDVIAGYVVGATVGFLVPHLHKKAALSGRLVFYPGVGGSTLILKLQ